MMISCLYGGVLNVKTILIIKNNDAPIARAFCDIPFLVHAATSASPPDIANMDMS